MRKLNTLEIIGITATAVGAATTAAIVGTKFVLKKIEEKKQAKEDKILQLNMPAGVGDDSKNELLGSELKSEDIAGEDKEPRINIEDIPKPRRELN